MANAISRLTQATSPAAAMTSLGKPDEMKARSDISNTKIESETSVVSDDRFVRASDEAQVERRRAQMLGDSEFQWTPRPARLSPAVVINDEQEQYQSSSYYFKQQELPPKNEQPERETSNEFPYRSPEYDMAARTCDTGPSPSYHHCETDHVLPPSLNDGLDRQSSGRSDGEAQRRASLVSEDQSSGTSEGQSSRDWLGLTTNRDRSCCTVDTQGQTSGHTMKAQDESHALPSSKHAPRTQEEFAFGNRWLGFPTTRRPCSHRQAAPAENLTGNDKIAMEEWFSKFPDIIGDMADTAERVAKARALIWTWRHLFVTDVRDMPATDLIIHRIPTYEGAVPRIAKPKLYTAEEEKWERENFPKLEEAGIITRTNSPWSARTKYPRRQNGTLRMVHNFVPINKATIKSNYPMRRIEPILQNIGRPWVQCMFKSDASNGYWAVCTYKKHVYKSAFSSSLGQWAYWRMGQGLTGACGTYAQLKDIVTGSIPGPSPEPALNMAMPGRAVFDHFVDDDIGGADSFESLYDFLNDHYFPRLAWARLTLNPFKTTFFASKIAVLGHEKTRLGVRPAAHKLRAFAQYHSPTTPRELDEFLWQLPFFKWYCPGRSDYTEVMKEAIRWEYVEKMVKGKKTRVRDITAFVWTDRCEVAFQACKEAILSNICAAGDPSKQFHIATDASGTGAGGLLFQLLDHAPGTLAKFGKHVFDDMAIIMFMSFKFTDAERKYHTTEREALSVLKCLEESRFLIKGSSHETVLYTDHSALVSIIQGDDARDRISRWQYRLSEYDLHIVHVPGKDLTVADGLSRLRHGDDADYGPPEPELAALAVVAEDDAASKSNPAQNDSSTSHDVGDTPYELPSHIAELWREYLEDSWYEEPLLVALGANIPNARDLLPKQRKAIRRFAARLILYEDHQGPLLGYKSNSGKRVQCVLQKDVKDTLRTIHDTHTHFATEISSQTAVSTYFWPTMLEDINEWCRTCPQCQFLGPLRPTRAILPIITIAPMDMIGMDYVGPIKPESLTGNKYILIVVDYFTRFVWAKAVPVANSQATSDFLNEIAATFGWPIVAYSDNGSHFHKFCTTTLEGNGVKQIFAPISHPQSVGLSERYVQAVLAGLRKVLQGDPQRMWKWDEFLPIVVHSLRLRPVRSLGYSPYKLMLGFEPRAHRSELSIDERIRAAVATIVPEQEISDHICAAGDRAELVKMAKHDEIRDLSSKLRSDEYERRAKIGGTAQDRRLRKWALPEQGDLVLVRRTYQDGIKGHKLEPRWQGPMEVDSVSWHGQSAILRNPKTQKIGGRYHLNDLKVFCKRKEEWDIATEKIIGLNELVRRILTTDSENVKARLIEEIDFDEDFGVLDETESTTRPSNWWSAGRPQPSTAEQGDEGDYEGEEINLFPQ